MGRITVANKKNYNGPGVYIGRPSPLGNPFPLTNEAHRKDVIDLYRDWLKEMYAQHGHVYDELHRLAAMEEDIILICWCAPKACHGDVIKKAIISIRAYGDIRLLNEEN